MESIPAPIKLLIGAAGIFACYAYSATLTEDVYKTRYGEEQEKFQYTLLTLLFERGISALVGLLGIMLFGGSGLKVPYMDITYSGVTQSLAMYGSNEALRFVSFPTQVLGKSCKMVPVMAGGVLLGGKKFSALEYLQVALITAGVCIFNLVGKSKAGGADSSYGLALIGFSLLMDAVTGGLQDRVKVRTKELNAGAPSSKPTTHESMMYTNAAGCAVIAVVGFATGEITAGFAFCGRHPQVLTAIAIYSLASAMGQNFIYYTITNFNPLVLTTVTTTRKIFTTVYSVFRDPSNSLNTMQWSGCAAVFLGLALDIVRNYMKSSAAGAAKKKDAPASPSKPKRSAKAS